MKTIYLAPRIMSFGKWLKANRKAKGFTQDQLAEQVSAHGINTTAGYISNLEREYYKNQFGEPTRPNERLVDAIATVLQLPLDEARAVAGYAPATATRKPSTIPELVEALESLGIETPLLHGGFPKDEDGEGFREIVERIWLDIQLVTSRINKWRARAIPQRLELYEDENSTMQSEPPLLKVK